MRTILWELSDGTKITITTENEECINKMNTSIEALADKLDMTVEMEEI